ncbi:Gfo/Idh/MocA family oxidoreductase [Moritella marina ATCC 15381]|uniref:Gfo/Idh/MocA family oxidoreductase n=1 Tax=Moritella marina ATCC 15381 TaxID=1202962 RepID=A0A5J6WMQ1_MORMI|nr:Gfo/Idh/MocA family oxidoreductase [Moritella marina]QFI38085.1 Gfo/Idh/MocA family oxidoreductase [Moritella marina ATCC 15381]
MANTDKAVRWGIAGLGNIAKRFATALNNSSKYGELYAVAARDLDRAEQFSEAFKSNVSYGCYEDMARDPNVDAVYIATIHPYHYPLVELFLTHKKHVFVEKPAFTNLQDWLTMKALATRNEVLLLEAMKTVTFPAYQELKHYLVKNNLQLTSIEASFGNEHQYDPELSIFNPNLSGGATLDVGVYGLWLYCDLCKSLGADVPEPAVDMSTLVTQSYVDTDTCFTFTGQINGKISASIVKNLPRVAILRGEQLVITIRDKWWNPYIIDVEYQGELFTIEHPATGNGFEFEIDHFSLLILENKTESDTLLPAITTQVQSIMEFGLINAGYGYLTQRGGSCSLNGKLKT